jgi:hypothetical protein
MMMFKGRPWYVRKTFAAAAGVTCLAVAACGGSATSSAGAAPSATSTVDPLASLTATQVSAKAVADAEVAPSLTFKGSVVQSGQPFTLDLAIKPGHGCAGTIDEGSKGGLKLIVIGKTVYLNPNATFWKANGGADAGAAIALVDGRYLEVSTSDAQMGSLATMCDVKQLFSSDDSTHPVAREAVTTLNGTRVLPIKISDGSIDYVTDTSKPEFVEGYAPKGSKAGAGTMTVSVGAPVTLTAPPASQVIDGSKLGL